MEILFEQMVDVIDVFPKGSFDLPDNKCGIFLGKRFGGKFVLGQGFAGGQFGS